MHSDIGTHTHIQIYIYIYIYICKCSLVFMHTRIFTLVENNFYSIELRIFKILIRRKSNVANVLSKKSFFL